MRPFRARGGGGAARDVLKPGIDPAEMDQQARRGSFELRQACGKYPITQQDGDLVKP